MHSWHLLSYLVFVLSSVHHFVIHSLWANKLKSLLMEEHKIHVDRRQGVFCFFLQNNTRHPQNTEWNDKGQIRGWGCHKLIHRGLVQSLVTLWSNVSEQFYTLLWYAGSQSRLHSRESKRQGHHWLPLSEMPRRHCRLRQTWARQNHYTRWVWNWASRRAFMCELKLPDDYRLLQLRDGSLIQCCRAEGCLQIGVWQSDKY